MRITVLAAAERTVSASLDAAMLDGAALAGALHAAGHDVELATVPAPAPTLFNRAVGLVDVGSILFKLAVQDPAPDAILMVAPPNGPSLVAETIGALRGIPGAVLLTSLTTEARQRTGELAQDGLVASLLSAVEATLLRRTRILLVPTEAVRRRVLLKGAASARVRVLKDMFAPILPRPTDAGVAALRSRLADGADFLVLLAAPLGAATELGALTGALTRLKDDHAFAFAAVGGGSRAEMLAEMVAARGIRNAKVVTLGRADRRAAVHAADALVGLAVPAQDGLCVPRSISRAIWARKPLIAVGPEGCELIRETRRMALGPTVSAGDADGLATVLRTLARDPAARAELGRRAEDAAAAMGSLSDALVAHLRGEVPADAASVGTEPALA
jgi:hypothetical protein